MKRQENNNLFLKFLAGFLVTCIIIYALDTQKATQDQKPKSSSDSKPCK